MINLMIMGKFIFEETGSKSFQPHWWDYVIFYGVIFLFGWLVVLALKAFDPYD
jgi:uncharacterized membrane-anchored protein